MNFRWHEKIIRAFLCGLWLCVPSAHLACKQPPPPERAPSVEKWTCPMHPQIVSEKPGECPICNMRLVALPKTPPLQVESQGPTGGSKGAEHLPIAIDTQRQQLLGLTLVAARRTEFSAAIRTSGRFAYDETRVHHIHTRYEAYVEHVFADFTGKFVRKGEPLLSLYSPDLLAAEQEYLIAVKSQQDGPSPTAKSNLNLIEAARQKLLLWNISARDIAELERNGKPSRTMNLYAPSAGYVIAKTAVHGMRVKPEDSLFDVVDLSRLWVLADVYEYELPRLRLGQTAIITVPYWPDRSWSGRISYIYPSVDPLTRTIRVRLEVDNARAELKAEMLANVTIAIAPRTALVVPDDAVLETGTRKLVFVSQGDGKLVPREVTTGDRANQLFEIKAGLREGEQVAMGATFLVDSESRLQAALQGMSTKTTAPPDGGVPSPTPAPAHDDHAGHNGH